MFTHMLFAMLLAFEPRRMRMSSMFSVGSSRTRPSSSSLPPPPPHIYTHAVAGAGHKDVQVAEASTSTDCQNACAGATKRRCGVREDG